VILRQGFQVELSSSANEKKFFIKRMKGAVFIHAAAIMKYGIMYL
jgi:hypothetical protein